jgi:hypothetical protein
MGEPSVSQNPEALAVASQPIGREAADGANAGGVIRAAALARSLDSDPHTCGIPLTTRVEFRRSVARCSDALR